jgi:hypothetical protein
VKNNCVLPEARTRDTFWDINRSSNQYHVMIDSTAAVCLQATDLKYRAKLESLFLTLSCLISLPCKSTFVKYEVNLCKSMPV